MILFMSTLRRSSTSSGGSSAAVAKASAVAYCFGCFVERQDNSEMTKEQGYETGFLKSRDFFSHLNQNYSNSFST